MNLRLSPEARRGWDRLSSEEGVSLTALIEALGLELDEHRAPTDPYGWTVVERARRIDHERGTRR